MKVCIFHIIQKPPKYLMFLTQGLLMFLLKMASTQQCPCRPSGDYKFTI